MSAESLRVGGLTLEVRRSRRRRTLELIVDRDGTLKVYAPEDTPTNEMVPWVRRKQLWIHGKLATKA